MKKTQEKHRHIIACLVDNEFGVLARVIGLFSGRGYNIESLTVAEVDHDKNLSRITIVTSGNDMVIEQIKALLERVVPVHKVVDLTVEGDHVERELALVKVLVKPSQKVKTLKIADEFRARLIDSTDTLFVFEATGTPAKIDEFLTEMRTLGLVESCRTGSVAISRSAAAMKAE
jgi:acetolactate synthase-1/3 small subunit